MSDIKKSKSYSEQLKDKLKDLRMFSSDQPAHRGFNFKDLNDFIRRSHEVRKTFKDEDLIQLNSSR